VEGPVATACVADAEVWASSLTPAMVVTGAGARLAARATFSVGHGRAMWYLRAQPV
jgi:hypothetical protein